MIKSIKKLYSLIKRQEKNTNHISFLDQHIIALPEYKVLYFAIPKVANSSMKKVCADLLNIDVPSGAKISSVFNERDFPFVRKNEIVNYKDYFKFCFIRNPWDRLVSCYLNKIRSDNNLNSEVFVQGVHKGFLKYGVFRAGISFAEFAKAITNIPDPIAERHFRSQYTFITDEEGKILVNFIGKFECLNEDFLRLCEQTGIPKQTVPHLLKTDRKSYQEYYTNEIKDIVWERYSKDIEMFGYEF